LTDKMDGPQGRCPDGHRK